MKFKDLEEGDKFRRTNHHKIVRMGGIGGGSVRRDLYNVIYTKENTSCGNVSLSIGGCSTLSSDCTVYKIEKQKTKVQQKEKFGTLKLAALK